MTPERLVVLDFEATCDDTAPPDPQEIIEFPSVLVDPVRGEVLDTFETFVRPVHHPQLTPFCTELTSIVDDDVVDAPLFLEAFAAHQAWMRGHGLSVVDGDGGREGVIVTCGDWDLANMLPKQLRTAGVSFVPHVYRRWINVKAPFGAWRNSQGRTGMTAMLEALELPLLGRHHRGIDDCHNIARIVFALLGHGVPFAPTSRLSRSRYPEVSVVLVRDDVESEVVLRRRTLDGLLAIASSAFRSQVRSLVDEGGAPVDEPAVLDLSDGARLRVAAR